MTIRELWGERFGLDAPRKIICVGLNYRDHAAEGGREAPAEPLLFAKLPTALIEPGEAIVLPPEDDHVDSEAELAVVIGRAGRRIPREAALDHVAGYTVANDVSARTLQRNDGQWLRAKSFDTFCPVLPALVGTEELGDASGLRVTQRLNGETLQDANTDDFLFDVPTADRARVRGVHARAGRPDPDRDAVGRRRLPRPADRDAARGRRPGRGRASRRVGKPGRRPALRFPARPCGPP